MPRFKKAMGRIYAVEYNKEEQRAMEKEIHRQFAEYERLHNKEIDAMALLVLHEEFGFGPARLKRFFDRFEAVLDNLLETYEGDEDINRAELCFAKLKEYGVDLDIWEKERKNERNDIL